MLRRGEAQKHSAARHNGRPHPQNTSLREELLMPDPSASGTNAPSYRLRARPAVSASNSWWASA
jgi:hypothetical protein